MYIKTQSVPRSKHSISVIKSTILSEIHNKLFTKCTGSLLLHWYVYKYVYLFIFICVGQDSSVGIATRYSRDISYPPDRHCGPHSVLNNRHRESFQGVKRPGCHADHPFLAPRLSTGKAVSIPPLCAWLTVWLQIWALCQSDHSHREHFQVSETFIAS
jgi:hypothetical protein